MSYTENLTKDVSLIRGNELVLLNEQEVLGKKFRVYGTVETPYFLARDVADWIEHKDVSTMMRTVDDEERVKVVAPQTISGGLQGNTEYWFLTEDGLYEVLMQSRKPIAKQFKKKVKEILKTLRKTGGYISNTDKFIEMYFDDIPEDQKRLVRTCLLSIEEKQKKINNLQSENDLLAQKALEWADRPLINALVRAYAHSIGDDFQAAWIDFKKELLYRNSINLNSRITAYLNQTGKKTKPKTLDMLDESELPQALSTAVALCRNNGVDISEIIEKKQTEIGRISR